MLEQSSFFLDPALLPRVQYVSMVLDNNNENDLSAEADALAMKYLSDEQLTQLAKLRLSSPAGKSGGGGRRGVGREFDRILGTPCGDGNFGRRSNNSTLYGPNHMSFASRKYLERYGLLENNTSGGGSGGGGGSNFGTPQEATPTTLGQRHHHEASNTPMPPDNTIGDNTVGEWDTSTQQGGAVRVKDFLAALRERSFDAGATDNSNIQHQGQQQHQQQFSNNQENAMSDSHRRNSYHSQSGSDASSSGNPNQIGAQHHQNQAVPSTPANQILRKSNEKFAQTPQSQQQNQPQHTDNRPIFNTSAPHLETAEKPINVFDKVPMSVPRQRNAPAIYRNEGAQGDVGTTNNQVENVLDIQRLRELPKLL